MGHFCAGSASDKQPCNAGSFSSSSGAHSCTPCVPGKFSLQSGANTSDACVACGSGKFSTETGASACIACVAGKYSLQSGANTSDACIGCVAGKYSLHSGANTLESCIACVAGKYSTTTAATSAEACKACGYGRFTPSDGATHCQGCAAGNYFRNSSQDCGQCPGGTFSAESATVCKDCAAGKYSESATATATTGPSECKDCDAGTWSSKAATSCYKLPSCPDAIGDMSADVKALLGGAAPSGATKVLSCGSCDFYVHQTTGTLSRSGVCNTGQVTAAEACTGSIDLKQKGINSVAFNTFSGNDFVIQIGTLASNVVPTSDNLTVVSAAGSSAWSIQTKDCGTSACGSYIKVGDEIMELTPATDGSVGGQTSGGDTYTVKRARLETKSESHAAGDAVFRFYPANVTAMTSMTGIDLSQNNISKLDISTFTNNTALRSLNLSHNPMSCLPSFEDGHGGCNSLREVSLHHTKLAALNPGDDFENCDQLRFLRMEPSRLLELTDKTLGLLGIFRDCRKRPAKCSDMQTCV